MRLLWIACLWTALASDPADRITSASAVYGQARAGHARGEVEAEVVYRWSLRLFEAERDAGGADAAQRHLDRMRLLEDSVAQLVAHGRAPASEADAVRWYRLAAEELASASAGSTAPPPDAPPASAPAAPAPAVQGPAIEDCFTACEGDHETCTTEAEHFRLGLGSTEGAPERCVTAASETCGDGGARSRVECREVEVRTCWAAIRSEGCAEARTSCVARCR